ncbi:MAG: tRNA pseudouridine(55) synthase TruB [Chloroflexi bacterium]|nr:tRNA pseudouridine(55) synthase TruB [Chloroflexota bacterium]
MSGVLVIDKPQGWTSHDVVARVRRMSGVRRVGHSGTLDPMATGVLVVCLGSATRIIEYLPDNKTYRARIHFGIETDTWDAEGQPVALADAGGLERDQVQALLAEFVGPILQRPPMYSALKRDGVPLYKLARQGVVVERTARPVTIHRLTMLRWAPPMVDLEVHCSAGTYIRALAHDLGQHAGTGAHLAVLRRTAVGHLGLSQALPQEALLTGLNWQDKLLSLRWALQHLPSVVVSDEGVQDLALGRAITLQAPAAGDTLCALDQQGALVAVLRPAEHGHWRPVKVLAGSGQALQAGR